MSDQNINLNLPKDPKRKIWLDWIQIVISILTMAISFVALFVTIPNVISNSNEQTQVVIEPRDGDIIVKDILGLGVDIISTREVKE